MRRVTLGFFSVMLLAGTGALGGAKQTVQVSIIRSGAGGFAFGSMGDARASADVTQEIGCSAYLYSTRLPFLDCYAIDAAGTYVSCYSYSADMVAMAASISPDAHLLFRWGATGECTELTVNVNSRHRPKTP